MFSSKKTVAVKAAPTTNSVPTPIQSWSDQVDLAEKKTMPQKPDTLMSMTDFLLEEPFLSEKEAPKASFHAHTPIMKKPGVLNIQGVPIIKGAEASQGVPIIKGAEASQGVPIIKGARSIAKCY